MKKVIWVIVLVAVIVVIWVIYALNTGPGKQAALPPGTPAPSASPTPAFDQNISDGTITVSYPSADFGLATTSSQILAKSYIPPCNDDFNYCLYYIGNAYQGTNFESAGIRIDKRTDLTTQSKCLTTEPDGFSGLTPTIVTSSDYAASVFAQVGGAAAGHFANGSLYRLFYGGACYEFETRVGQSDFMNYPSGSIQQFTSADQDTIQTELMQVLDTLTIASSGEQIVFPTSAPAATSPSM